MNERSYPYDIEADWNLDLLCNFHCTYCISRSDQCIVHYDRDRIHAIKRFFGSRTLRWHLHFTGGEPFLIDGFIDLCTYFTNRHFISINSNLTTNRVDDFAKLIDPERVLFINAGLHVLEREKHRSLNQFVDKLLMLRQRGFHVFPSYVMAPELFDRFKSDFEFFKTKGITIFPKVMRSTYLGQTYPEAYSHEQRTRFKQFVNMAHDTTQTLADIGQPLIDLSLDMHFVDGIPTFHGMMCGAGRRFVRIWWDGTITRCDHASRLGSVFANSLCLFEEERPCDTYSCPYFCAKLTRLCSVLAKQ